MDSRNCHQENNYNITCKNCALASSLNFCFNSSFSVGSALKKVGIISELVFEDRSLPKLTWENSSEKSSWLEKKLRNIYLIVDWRFYKHLNTTTWLTLKTIQHRLCKKIIIRILSCVYFIRFFLNNCFNWCFGFQWFLEGCF